MKKITKILALILAICMLSVLFTGCGKEEAPAAPSTPAAPSDPAAPAAPSAPADVKPVTLKLSHNTAATSITGVQYQAFADLVAEESGGSVNVEIYAAGSLVDDTGILDAVMDGTCDMGHGMVAYMDGLIKDLVPLEIPGYYSGDSFLEFSNGVQGIMESIMADYGIKFIGCNYQGQAGFVATEAPVQSPADLNGKAVRASGTYISKAVEAWGGAPTTIALPDLTTALERKTVDVAYTGWTVIGGFKLYEMAPNVTFTTITESYGCLIMSMDSFEKLSAEQQAAVDRAAERWREETYNVGVGYRQQYIDEMKAAGVNVVEFTAEQTQPFTDLTAPMFGEIEGQLGEKGLELLNTLNALNGK